LTRRHVEFTWAGVRPLTFDIQQPMGRRTREIHDLGQAGAAGIFAMTAGPVMSHLSAGRAVHRLVADHLGPAVRAGTTNPASHRGMDFGISKPIADERRAVLRRTVLQEHARDLKGVLYTRTGLAWRGHLDRAVIEEAATSIADLAGWSEARTGMEIDSFAHYQKTVFRNGAESR